jgi:hypothetical protein
MSIEYKTLDMHLRECEGNTLVEAFGPDGEWAEECTEMPTREDLLSIFVKFSERDLSRKDLEQVGDRLGRALMPNRIFQLYTSVLQRTLNHSDRGLRLKLHFMDSTNVYKRLPWEAIRINGRAIVMDPRQVIVRTIDMSDPMPSLALEKPPYRVMIVTSLPEDMSYVVTTEQVEQIEEVLKPLAENDLIQIEIYHNIPFSQFEDLLRKGNFHIFHFIGHAGPKGPGQYTASEEDDIGYLYFVDEIGQAEAIDAQRLGIALLNTTVKLAFVNAITGVGIAEHLLRAGLPIVIGNIFPVTNAEALEFGSAFYAELLRTNSLEQAVAWGRRVMIRGGSRSESAWVTPGLFMRVLEGKFWAGEAGYKIETFIHNGQLVTEAKQKEDFNANTFAYRLQVILDELDHITSPDDRLKAQQLVAEIRDAIANSELEKASLKLSEVSTFTLLSIKEQIKEQKALEESEKTKNETLQSERRARWTVLSVSVALLMIVAILGYALHGIWTPTMSIPVISLPISVVVWSFVGGVAAMLQAFVGTKNNKKKEVNYEWLFWRPVVGVIMGSVLYLAVSAGLAILGNTDLSVSNPRNNYILWALAFLGGFSDKFAILVFDNIVRTFSKSSTETSSSMSAAETSSEKAQKTNESSL